MPREGLVNQVEHNIGIRSRPTYVVTPFNMHLLQLFLLLLLPSLSFFAICPGATIFPDVLLKRKLVLFRLELKGNVLPFNFTSLSILEYISSFFSSLLPLHKIHYSSFVTFTYKLQQWHEYRSIYSLQTFHSTQNSIKSVKLITLFNAKSVN